MPTHIPAASIRSLPAMWIGLYQGGRAGDTIFDLHLLDAIAGQIAVGILTRGALQNMVEPYLLRENLLTKDKVSMRVITEKGQRHLEMTAWPVG